MSPRIKTLAAGSAVTVGAIALIIATAAYDLGAALLVGLAAGALVALVPGETGTRKIAGFVTGILVTAAAYGLRAGVLPDSTLGAVIGIGVLLALVTLIAVATNGRTPLWASLAGVTAMAGAYETTHIVDFAGFFSNIPMAIAGVLLASAVGFTAASLVGPTGERDDVAPELTGDLDETRVVELV